MMDCYETGPYGYTGIRRKSEGFALKASANMVYIVLTPGIPYNNLIVGPLLNRLLTPFVRMLDYSIHGGLDRRQGLERN